MQKVVKGFLMVMVAMVTSLGFVACDKDDDNKATVSLEGKWITMSDNFKELLIVNADHTFLLTGADDEKTWANVEGVIELNGNNITLTFYEGGNNVGTYTLADNKLTLTMDGTTRVYNKLIEDFSIVGSWGSVKTQSFIKAVKDEIKLPFGSIVNGEEIPISVKTANVKGEFIDEAVKAYFRDVEFKSDGEMTYKVVKEGEEVSMTKQYSLVDNMLRVTGKVGNVDIDNMFMAFQNANQTETYLFLTKESVGSMFVGYAMMLREGNVSEGSIEALDTFAAEFMEAFENFATIIYLQKQ